MSDENHGPSGAVAGCAGARELAGEPARRGHFLDAAHLDAWLRAHADDLARDIAALVRIPSVSAPPHARAEAGAGSCLPVAADTAGKDVPPFGRECARVVDATRGIVEGLGLVWRNHGYYAASALLASACAGGFDAVSASGAGAAPDAPAARPRIAFFSHVDVVAAGDGWSHDPFDPYVRDGWLFGRGAADNKGAVVAVLYALAYVKGAGYCLDHDVVAYLGCDEERGMEDVRYLLRTEPPARVNLVSDAHWPVCVAEKGIVEGTMSVRLDDPALRSFEGGTAHNAVPDRVEARLAGSRLAHSLTFLGRGGHSAFPEGTDNAIVKAARALADEEHGALLSERTRAAFRALADAFQDVYGTGLGIAATDEVAGPTTAVVSLARYEEGVLTVTFNIRYAATADGAEVVRRVRAAAERAGFELGEVSVDPAHRAQEADGLARDLTAIVNQVLGTDLTPYGLAGGTHARRIPGAVGFGPGRRDAQEPTVPAHGKGHEPDEAVSLASLLDAVRIYVRAILHLDAHPELAPAAGGFSLDGSAGVSHNSY